MDGDTYSGKPANEHSLKTTVRTIQQPVSNGKEILHYPLERTHFYIHPLDTPIQSSDNHPKRTTRPIQIEQQSPSQPHAFV
jgi:hypothetical protein